MGQEVFDIEDCVQEKNKRKVDINMLRKTKRTLSLVLALIMICSTMGVMAFATVTLAYECGECGEYTTDYYRARYSKYWDRIAECPTHEIHDANVYICQDAYYCDIHDVFLDFAGNPYEVYECIR